MKAETPSTAKPQKAEPSKEDSQSKPAQPTWTWSEIARAPTPKVFAITCIAIDVLSAVYSYHAFMSRTLPEYGRTLESSLRYISYVTFAISMVDCLFRALLVTKLNMKPFIVLDVVLVAVVGWSGFMEGIPG